MSSTEKWQVNPKYQNLEPFVRGIDQSFDTDGETIFAHRNTIKFMDYAGIQLAVKSYQLPKYINKFVYGRFRKPKAERSYINACNLLKNGIGTPEPVGYYYRRDIILRHSYYISLRSSCIATFHDLWGSEAFRKADIYQAMAESVARMHERGMRLKDLSNGNIMFDDRQDPMRIEFVDLNRFAYGPVSLQVGCTDFQRLYVDAPDARDVFSRAYAKVRGFDPEQCKRWMTPSK